MPWTAFSGLGWAGEAYRGRRGQSWCGMACPGRAGIGRRGISRLGRGRQGSASHGRLGMAGLVLARRGMAGADGLDRRCMVCRARQARRGSYGQAGHVRATQAWHRVARPGEGRPGVARQARLGWVRHVGTRQGISGQAWLGTAWRGWTSPVPAWSGNARHGRQG